MNSNSLAIVSGSSRGIGKGIANILLERGWSVFITGRSAKDVEKTYSEFKKKYDSQVYTFIGDLTKAEAIEGLKIKVQSTDCPLRLVVANLGSGKSKCESIISTKEVRRLFELNFFSSINLCEAFSSLMEKGNIIFISSIAGCESIQAPLGYSAAKAALLSASKTLSNLLASKNIRVNSISPGNILFEGGSWDENLKNFSSHTMKYIQENVPLNRFGRVEEIAQAIEFIIDNEFFTGQNLIIDGGQVKGFI